MRPWLLVLVGCGQMTANEPAIDSCALPAGTDQLDPRLQSLLARRAVACTDHRGGRITDDEYKTRVAAIDAELAGRKLVKREPQQPLDDRLINWASSVVEYSTQYSDTSWSAVQVLGKPDVFPAHGDHNKAWASKGADDRDEFIEVAFDRKEPVSAVEVYETFNPGAIDKIELVTTKGRRIEIAVADKPAPGIAAHRVFETRCTREPIASVRIHLDSMAVAGWNEIDAIGVVPCTR